MLKLIIEDDEGRKTVVPFVRDEITIGRQEGNTIRLTERNVSRRHARLLRQSGAVKIEDLGSSNGIRVNGDRISGLVQVSDGDLIQIGDYDLAIQREDEQRATSTTPMQVPSARASSSVGPTQRLPSERETAPTMPALPAVDPPSRASDATPPPGTLEAVDGAEDDATLPKQQSTSVIRIDQVQTNRREVIELDSSQAPKLVVINTEFAGREFLISKTETRIGRVDDNDIYLDHRSLSRTHCKVVREDNGEWRVIDMQSANGLMVNGEPYAQVTLRSGDVIELGHVKMKFVGPGESFSDAPTTATVVETGEFEQLSSSKAPMIAVIATVLVLVVGGGGYALMRGRGTTTKPVDPPPVKVAVAVVDPVKPPPIEPDVPVPPDPVDASPEDASKKALTEAQAALDVADLATAETALRSCKVGAATCPQVSPMLAMIDAEKIVSSNLNEAMKALEAKQPQVARAMLDSAKSTKVFKARVAELEAKYKTLTEKTQPDVKRPDPVAVVPKKPDPVAVVPKKPDPVVVAAASTNAETEKLVAEAKVLIKEGSFNAAIERLKRCLQLDPSNLPCIRNSASAHSRLSQEDNSPSEFRQACNFYEQYLRVAPADDVYVSKIKNILESGPSCKP